MKSKQVLVVFGSVVGLWFISMGSTPVNAACPVVVPAAASAGVSFGNVVAEQTYSYQATGVAGFNLDGCQSDPDGNIVAGPCLPIISADGSFTCPGLKGVSLVGKVNGTCIQLGSSGTFVAPSSGPLTLYYNDSGYGDNNGSWNVCITPVEQECVTVPADAAGGVSFGNVVAGQTYGYTVTGTASYDCPGGLYVDANGLPFGSAYSPADTNFTCPGLMALSLVGKVNGTCIQLGTSGTFVAPSTGQLFLLMNDSVGGFYNNCGAWNACITSVPPACVSVPAAAAGGVSFGNVVAGQTYSYQATGAVGFNLDGCQSDPNGNIVAGPCGPIISADGSFTCPGLKGVSLVGKVNGTCIQLGSSGTFVAPSSGSLTLYFNDSIYGDNNGSWNVCITPVPPECVTVPATAAGGVSFGNVVAGQTYSYQASGAIGFNFDGCQSDPDGNMVAGPCGGPILADGSFICPGLLGVSLVGKINGGSCVQLGKSGSFVAPASGTLVLYFNDQTFGYSDNSGSWNVCITPVEQDCVTVPATAAGGVSFGNVVAGQTYSYQATGAAGFNLDGCQSDPDGNIVAGACGPIISADGGFTCPGLKGVSLVGQVNGTCIQMGSSGTFVAPSSGPLTLYYNDSIYSDNNGSWNVCITTVQPPCDGIPDAWMQLHFGHPDGQVGDLSRAGDDPDGDGFTNRQEFQAGTDPTSSGSTPFRITAIVQEGDDIRITWTTVGGTTNTLERSAGYSNNFVGIFTVTNTVGTITNCVDLGAAATNVPSLYYRVRLVP